MSSISLINRFLQSRIQNREAYVSLEKDKKGNLRVGTSGILEESGDVAGACVRKAHLRQLGIELDPPTPDKLIMFDLGYASEDIIHKRLQATLQPGEVILREEEIPTTWFTNNGTKVTGRPDMVICEASNLHGITNLSPTVSVHVQQGVISPVKPVLGIELKSVHSMWTARDVLFKHSPKLPNMIQAAHYMWQMGIPWKLVYTGYSQLGQGMAGDYSWIQPLFPRPGEFMSEYVEYTYNKIVPKEVLNKKTGKMETKPGKSPVTREEWDKLSPDNRNYTIKHIKQFDLVFDLRFDAHGRLEYRNETDIGSWTPTIVTRDSIRRYFEFVSQMEPEQKLGPRPGQVDIHGDKAGYKDCDYCKLKDTCTAFEKHGYETWLNEVKKVAT